MTTFLFRFLSLKDGRSSIYYFFLYINLPRKAKRKQGFPMVLHRKYYEERTTIITQLLTTQIDQKIKMNEK